MTVVELKNLKTLRIAQGWTVQELARRANVAELFIRRLETPNLNGPIEGTDSVLAERLITALGTDRATIGHTEHKR
jgi:transcriptional regulator with XRE-family HTH domain